MPRTDLLKACIKYHYAVREDLVAPVPSAKTLAEESMFWTGDFYLGEGETQAFEAWKIARSEWLKFPDEEHKRAMESYVTLDSPPLYSDVIRHFEEEFRQRNKESNQRSARFDVLSLVTALCVLAVSFPMLMQLLGWSLG